MKERDPLLESPTAKAAYAGALEGFVRALCQGLRAEDARLLGMSFREHSGVIVFSDRSGGISFEVKVTFNQVMDYQEVMALVGALAEKNGPSMPTWAGDPAMAAEVQRKLR